MEHCNRLGWKEKYGFPSQMTMEAIGIKKHQTYIKYFRELVEYGFIKLIQESKNQYSANIISIQTAMPNSGKALDKALIKHGAKQTESTGQSTGQSTGHIYKQETIKQETINKEQVNKEQVNNIYSLYPSKCSIRNASNGKCEKNKEQIKKLLDKYSETELKTIIENYIKNCTATKTYMKNFTTFLNNLPVDLLNSIPETDKPQQKEKVFISGVEVVGYKEDGKPIYRHPG